MIRVLLVDDHELVRSGFRRLLDESEEIEVVGEAETGEEAIQLTREHSPDLVLMDVNMPGIGGIEATRKIRRQFPSAQVIAVTIHSDDPFPTKMHEAGAIGYINKGCPAEEMFEAIKSVAAGQPFVSKEVSQRLSLAKLSGMGNKTPFDKLSQREMQVMTMIIQGLKNQDISDSLCLSPKTISTYRHRLYEKLNVATDVELTFLAIRHEFVDFKA